MTDAPPEIDRLLRAYAAGIVPDSAAGDRLLSRLLAALTFDATPRRSWSSHWVPVTVPMAAALLGLVVGQGLAPVPAAPLFAGLFDATLFQVMGW